VLPALVFSSIAIQRPDQMYTLGTPAALALIGLGGTAILSAAITRAGKMDRERSVAIFLNASFMNYTFLGLAVVYTVVGILPGATGISGVGVASIYAVAMGVVHLTVGVALAAGGLKKRISIRKVTLSILTFPAAFALIVALIFVSFDVTFPIWTQSWVDKFANPAVVLMLLAAGYKMPLVDPRKYLSPLVTVGAIRLIACPIVTLGAIKLLGVSGTVAHSALILSCMPPGIFNLILAQRFGLDLRMYGALVFYLTLVSLFVAVPMVVFLGIV